MSLAPRPHIFGPVPSRRLGRSLGVDVVPFKTCTYDCIYCQLGPTTRKTVAREYHVPVARVLDELTSALEAGATPDYVTVSGSGEPTLCQGLAELIAGIKSRTAIPVAVLTNGSLLWQREVREDMAAADLVIPSLDAGDPEMFAIVNRPDPAITFEKMVSGLHEFRQGFAGAIWLEVFLLEGLTATPRHVEKIAGFVDKVQPDRVQLNSIARPPADPLARGVAHARLEELAGLCGDRAEVIMAPPASAVAGGGTTNALRIMELLRRRPCTLQDVATGLGLHPNEVLKYTPALVRDGKIELCDVEGASYYKVAARCANGDEMA